MCMKRQRVFWELLLALGYFLPVFAWSMPQKLLANEECSYAEDMNAFSVETLYPETNARSVAIQYPVFEEIKGKEKAALKARFPQLADTISYTIHESIERKCRVWDIRYCPYIQRGNRYFRLVSAEWKSLPSGSSVLLPEESDTSSSPKTFASAGTSFAAVGGRYAESSKLSSGKWTKISVEKSGIYKLTYDEIRNMGIRPDKVQIYGYGGRLLPEDFNEPYVDDLPEVAIYKNDKKQYILFYASGPLYWHPQESSDFYTRVNNHYSSKAYYFVGERAEGSIEAEKIASLSEDMADQEISAYTDFWLHEQDLYNIGATGRECYGEDFSVQNTQRFHFAIPNLKTDERASILVNFVARSIHSTFCDISVDEKSLGTTSYAPIAVSESYTYANNGSLRATFFPQSSSELTVDIHYRPNGAVPKCAHLNYIALNVRRDLVQGEPVLLFRDPLTVAKGKVGRFVIRNADAATMVLDVTSPLAMKQVSGTLAGSEYSFVLPTEQLHEYACVNLNGTIPSPKIEGKVLPQNLHALPQQDFVIICHSDFKEEALRLARLHEQYDGLRVAVVTAEQVYNEFSSGTPDATAYRRFMKMFYDRAATEEEMPQSLLLFGDGVYDNRLVTSAFSNSHLRPDKLLTFQSKESLEGRYSYVTDDYFGFLDDTEGADIPSSRRDIGVGRFPVRSLSEAKTAVDKVESYLKNKDQGVWKNTLCFLADDGDQNQHVHSADVLAENVKSNHPSFIVHKIYVDAYDRVETASGSTVPAANQNLTELLRSGLLMLNYSGHGSTTAWASEKLLTITDVKNMQNKRLPLWVTATCDFCRYDDSETSAGEYIFLNENGGAIALFTTSRVVYSSQNSALNKLFMSNVFAKKEGRRLSLGEILRNTKKSPSLSGDRNKLNFALIGDPALKLSYPEYKAEITELNGHDASQTDTLQALGVVEMAGRILRHDGCFAEDFDGVLYATVFDSESYTQTLGNAGNDVYTYKNRNNVLFSGKVEVKNGLFDFRFAMPKDIAYTYRSGLVNLYAHSADASCEAQGVYDQFVIGGTDERAVLDTIGPKIRLFLNDTTFVSGGMVNETPTLIALLEDKNGLNTGGGVGHDMQLTVDGKEHYVLNEYYASEMGDYTRGRIYYHLPVLSEGFHTLSLRAWDVQNNSSTAELSMQVLPGYAPRLMQMSVYQNAEKVSFGFEHNRPEMWMQVKLQIYDVWGRLQWQSSERVYHRDNTGETIEWNYKGLNGIKVPEGVYICRLSILTDGRQVSSAQKIVVGLQ